MKVNILRKIHYFLGGISGLWNRIEQEKWQNFRLELFRVFRSKDMIDESILIESTTLSYAISISFPEHKEEEVKRIIMEVAETNKVELDFSER